jgi:hypothetical protein
MSLRHLASAGLLAAGLAASAHADQGVSLASGYTDFTTWTLLGAASAQNMTPGNGFTYSDLTLTQFGQGDQGGAGFAPQALLLDFNAPIHFDFHFFILNPNNEVRGDGLSFTLAGAPGLGNAGSGLGYENLPGTSVAFAVDTFHFDGEPVSPSVQILQDGSATPVAYTETGLGDAVRNTEYQWLASVDWQPSGQGDNTGTLSGSIDNLKLGSFTVQAQLDLSGLAGAPVYYGFTASNGLATDGHVVSSAVPVPEPGMGALMLAGLAVMLSAKSRRRRSAG